MLIIINVIQSRAGGVESMLKTDISDILKNPENYFDKNVTVCGWVRTCRDSKNISFLEINDGSCFKNLQIIADAEKFSGIDFKPIATSLEIKGIIKKSPNPKQQAELFADGINVLGRCPDDYPIQKNRHTMEYLRAIPHLRLRTNTFNAMFRVRSFLSKAVHDFFLSRNFLYVHTPIITGSDCEGAGEIFKVTTIGYNTKYKSEEEYNSNDFFGKKAGLTVSGQLEGEAFATAFGKIYTFGPTFRAENSNTTRHAAEFWQIEPEVAFADLSDIIKLAEELIKYLINEILKNCPDETAFFDSRFENGLINKLNNIVGSKFEILEYKDAVEILNKSAVKFNYPVSFGSDLQTEHERYITEQIFKKPVFVINYPKKLKSFYMKQNPDGVTVAATDLLVPGVGEIIGASQREDNLELLEQRIRELNMKAEDYEWYLQLRKYGSVPHSGFGLGLERMLMYITGIGNIRDTAGFPRAKGEL